MKVLKGWFTLVELIVTITIVTILGTIAFISFQWYSKNARDGVRTSDTNSIQKTLEFFKIEKWFYPLPTNSRKISFSGWTLWQEWTFWDSVRKTTWKLNKTPLDPLTWNEYTYSVTQNKWEYELGIALEKTGYFSNAFWWSFFNTFIVWTYNRRIVSTQTWGIYYVLSTPTIISSDKSETDFTNIIEWKKLCFNSYKNLPSSYELELGWNEQGVFDFSWWDNILFAWNLEDFRDQQTRLSFYEKLSKRYNQSVLEKDIDYKKFFSVYADMYNPTLNFIKTSCSTTKELITAIVVECDWWDETEDIIAWSVETWALLPNGETNYIGQWPLGNMNWRWQGFQIASRERNSLWMTWSLNKSIGIKWKLFTQNKAASLYVWWYDINGDGNENILYWYGGKLYLWDTITGWNIWETKVLDIKAILWVEDILWNGQKSIIVSLGTYRYIGIINGLTWELDWISHKANGPIKIVKSNWRPIDYKVFDTNNDWIREYHFKKRSWKYNAFKFFKSWTKVVWETLWSSEGYWDYNEWTSDGRQIQQWSMWNMLWQLVMSSKWSNVLSFYSNDIDESLSWINRFKMPAFGKVYIWWGTARNSWIAYFYDINGDGNDEFIVKINEELNNNKLSRIIISWLNTGNEVTQFMSLSNPRVEKAWGGLTSYGNFSTPIALKNNNNPEESYILTKGRDPIDGINKRIILKYNWISSSWYKKISNENGSFNYEIIYDAFDSSYSPAWIFNNGEKDYIVLRKSDYYYFYDFNGINTFLSPSSLSIRGSFFWNTLFDWWYDIRRERNKNAWVFLAWYDTNWNGKNEFVVSQGGYFKFYEITDSSVNFIKQYGPTNTVSWIKKRWLSENNSDIYGITYNSSNNTINYYKTNSWSWSYTFTKITQDNFYSWWETRDLVISRLWLWEQRYNKLMIESTWMFDARNAKPANPPQKLSNDFFYSYDMNKDGENEVFRWDKAYKFNAPWNYSLKYDAIWRAWDFNGDGVLDKAWTYCTSTENYPNNVFLTIRSGIDWIALVPDLNRGNGNGRCTGWSHYSNIWIDFDNDWVDELIAWIAARKTRVISLTWGIATEWNQISPYSEESTLVAFDFDNDEIKEVVRWTNNAGVMKWSNINKTQLSSLVNIPWWVRSTWGISGWIPSYYNYNNKTYIAFRWVDWEVALKSRDGNSVKSLFNNYYLNAKKYNNLDAVLNNNLIPLATADVLLWDFTANWELEVLVWGWDGYIYIIWIDWNIKKAYNIGSAIKRIIIGDTNEDLLLDILISCEDGYVYQIASSRLDPPSIIRDGFYYWSDTDIQWYTKKVAVSFPAANNASGYFIQLYNKTHKSIVLDWIDIWSATNVCVNSADIEEEWCITSWRNFYLSKNSIYQWRVQSYNENISSPIAESDGFRVY